MGPVQAHRHDDPRRIAVSGSTGLVGTALCEALVARGDIVCPVVRRPEGKPGEIAWDTGRQSFDADALSACHAVVHLAGESIVGRWTDAKKRRVRESRVGGTGALCQALAGLGEGPKTLICASAVGYYGDTGQSDACDEDAPPGDDYLAQVCTAWEAACAPARAAGLRVVNLRIGMVLSPKGGALAAMLPAFRLGLGGRLGHGRQWVSWIGLHDIWFVCFCSVSIRLRLPARLTPSGPTRSPTGGSPKRWAGLYAGRRVLPVPGFAPMLLYGKECAQALVLGSLRVWPKRLLDAGFSFDFDDLEDALRHELNDTAG